MKQRAFHDGPLCECPLRARSRRSPRADNIPARHVKYALSLRGRGGTGARDRNHVRAFFEEKRAFSLAKWVMMGATLPLHHLGLPVGEPGTLHGLFQDATELLHFP